MPVKRSGRPYYSILMALPRIFSSFFPTTIDVDRLTEAELVDLGGRITARLRLLTRARAQSDMLEFKIGDRVAFQPPGKGQVQGKVARYNKRSVRVAAEDGRQWNVSPDLLKAVSAKRNLLPSV